VYMRERAGWGRGGSGFRRANSGVIHTQDGKGPDSEAPSLVSYTLRYVRLVEVDTVSGWVVRTDAPVCMRERGGWGREGSGLTVSRGGGHSASVWVVRTDAPVYMCERGGWGRGWIGGGRGQIKCTIVNRSCRIRRVCNFCEDE
jgi:hypothetical protein